MAELRVTEQIVTETEKQGEAEVQALRGETNIVIEPGTS
jgi:hypothetical protein